MADTFGDIAADAEIATLMRALAAGEPAHFWGAEETREVGEPRLTLWQEDGRLRLQGRSGVDFGAFGSIIVAWRFMASILAEEAGVEG